MLNEFIVAMLLANWFCLGMPGDPGKTSGRINPAGAEKLHGSHPAGHGDPDAERGGNIDPDGLNRGGDIDPDGLNRGGYIDPDGLNRSGNIDPNG